MNILCATDLLRESDSAFERAVMLAESQEARAPRPSARSAGHFGAFVTEPTRSVCKVTREVCQCQ